MCSLAEEQSHLEIIPVFSMWVGGLSQTKKPPFSCLGLEKELADVGGEGWTLALPGVRLVSPSSRGDYPEEGASGENVSDVCCFCIGITIIKAGNGC